MPDRLCPTFCLLVDVCCSAYVVIPQTHTHVQVAASVEELSSVFVGSCSKFRVELMPLPAGQTGPDSGAATADTAADAGAAAAAVQPGGGVGAGIGGGTPRPGHARPTPVSATPAPPKTLMYFDGCGLPLGCTVLLQGASAAELTKVKRVVKFGVLAAYHLGLEVNFLAEELTLATAALASPGVCAEPLIGKGKERVGWYWWRSRRGKWVVTSNEVP